MSATHIFPRTAIAALAFALAACGGGGGGGDSAATGAAAQITAASAGEISGELVDGLMTTAELGDFGNLTGLGQTTAGSGTASAKTVGTLAAKSNEAVVRYFATFEEAPIPCAAGGTASVSASLQEPGTLSPGDTIALSFADCDDGEGRVLSGALRLEVERFAGDFAGGLFDARLKVGFDVLTVTEAGEAATVNGDLTLALDTLGYPTVVYAHSGDALALTEDGRTLVFTDWLASLTVDANTEPAGYRLAGNGTVDLPRHGSVRYEVLDAFAGFGDAYPARGVLRVEGDAGASITLTALSSEQAQLEMDYDGDGVIDEVRLLNWAELED